MTTELRFKRPGGVELNVSVTSGRYFVSVLHIEAGSLVSANAMRSSDCKLWDVGGRWSLYVRDIVFWITADEARQLQETFGLEVRHAPARIAS